MLPAALSMPPSTVCQLDSTAAGEAAEAAVSRKKRDSRLYAAPKPAVRTNEALIQSGSFLRHSMHTAVSAVQELCCT